MLIYSVNQDITEPGFVHDLHPSGIETVSLISDPDLAIYLFSNAFIYVANQQAPYTTLSEEQSHSVVHK